jgi:hypothetical protein
MAKNLDHRKISGPKSPDNPINNQDPSDSNPQDFNPENRGDKPKPITDDEIRFLNTIDPLNPKNRPQR